MPYGDEIEADDRRRPRPARKRYDDEPDERDDDVGRPTRVRRPQRSGLVMAAGIVSISYGGLLLACGLIYGAGGACCATTVPWLRDLMMEVAPRDPEVVQAHKELAQAQTAGWLLIAIGLLRVAVGTGLVGGGIGVLCRSNVARFIVLGVALLNVLGICIDTVATVAVNLFEPGDLGTTIVAALFALAFAAFVFVVLLIPKHAKEFAG
jgi:hypothetical protein